MILLCGSLVIVAAIYAVIKKVDVRLTLIVAAVALGLIGQNLPAVIQKFFTTFTGPEYLIPIGSAMGFAYVLRHTECDRHLVHLLVNPLRRARAILIPGAVVVAFVVNIPIISQTSAAVAVGAVLIPLLLAARISPLTAGAALLMGASIGGELLNQGAPEFRTVIKETAALGIHLESASCVRAVFPLVMVHLTVATLVFWFISHRAERRLAVAGDSTPTTLPTTAADDEPQSAQTTSGFLSAAAMCMAKQDEAFRVNYFKAAVPLLPLVLLFLIAKPFEVIHLPHEWLVGSTETAALLGKASKPLNEPRLARAVEEAYDSRVIGLAMLIGSVVAALTDRKRALGVAGAFFEGAGYAVANIISIIVAAACFGEGVKQIGFDKVIGQLITAWPGILIPASGFLPLAFGVVSGSGMAATQSLFAFFLKPAVAMGVDPAHLGAVVSLGAAAGRTMSLVAAVTLMCGALTGTRPTHLARRVAPPLLLGMVAVVIAAMVMVK